MYLSKLEITNFRQFGEGDHSFVLHLNSGITALVGENDAGKTAIIDAIRMVLGTRDQEYIRVQTTDFHYDAGTKTYAENISICCTFDGLTAADRGAFAEHLSYLATGETVLHVTWTARRMSAGPRRFIPTEWRSGDGGEGPILDGKVRALLTATYLRPLRDAERALSAGRGSRLAQILQNTKEIKSHGVAFDSAGVAGLDPASLSLVGLLDYTNHHFQSNEGIKKAKERLNDDYLSPLSFANDELTAHIAVSGNGDEEARLRQILEKLDVILNAQGVTDGLLGRGLGSNNLLFMACELLLLASEDEGFPLLMIEEPEAHLHPQRQLRLMQFLQSHVDRPDGQKIQVIVTTHSPNLASEIRLDNMVLIKDRRAFSLAKGKTQLTASDYPFLQRYLDVTKANLFFARGVVVVEGPAENILIPPIAKLLRRDLEKYGVSIVDVKGTGLGRFARIFQREDTNTDGEIGIPVSCITDIDVMPDCAPWIVGVLREEEVFPALKGTRRKWRAKCDFPGTELDDRRVEIERRANGQKVRTFVANEWTLEYDLAFSGLDEFVWLAAHLADNDEILLKSPEKRADELASATAEYAALVAQSRTREELASEVYARFMRDNVSKAISAQYLAELLTDAVKNGKITAAELQKRLPPYLVEAIGHVTEALPVAA